MRLAIVRQTYTPFGGAERFVSRAVEALARSDLDVTIVARRWEGAPGLNLLCCDPFHLGRTWRDASFARCVRKLIDERRFDLVQSHERIAGCDIFRAGDGVHATWLDLRGRAGGARTRLGQWLSPWHRYTLAAESAMFRDPRLKAVICNSRMVRDEIARRFGVADAKLHVIYNGIDLARFSPALRNAHRAEVRENLGIADGVPAILYVGSGFERKGVAALVAAFARMKRRDARLWVIGKDKHGDRYAAQAQAAGVADRVSWLGPQADVLPWYGAADAFALPTLYDPFPNAALEAFACGLPVATSTSCGAAELIEPGRNGHVCDPLDIDALADALDLLCHTAPAMREAARATALPLSSDAMAARMVDLYRALLG